MIFSKVLTSTVLVDDTYSFRWHDAWGSVSKYKSGVNFPIDDTTGYPVEGVLTVVSAGTGDSIISPDVTGNNWAKITNAANEYDGVNYQINGEAFLLATNKPFYFGARLSISDATQSDLLIGLAETDTTLMAVDTAHAIAVGGDGLFFSKLDGVTSTIANVYDGGAAVASVACGTMDTDKHTYEIYFDGQFVNFYIDGVLQTKTADSLPNAAMTPSINFRAGAAAAKTCTIEWMRCIQIYA